VVVEGIEIAEVVVAGVGGGVVGVAVSALVECDEAPCGRECFGERREGDGFHGVSVESDERGSFEGGVEVGEVQAVAGKGSPLHAGTISKVS